VARRRSVWLALAGGVLLLAGAGSLLVWDRAELVVMDRKADRVLLREGVAPGDSFTLSYLHSVARTRVTGTFTVTPAWQLRVAETTFGSFGPGLPDLRPGDDYDVVGGVIRQRDPGQTLPGLLFAVQPYTEHRLQVGARSLDLSATVAPGGRVSITVRPPVSRILLAVSTLADSRPRSW
jgi:hypothetical protein